MLPRRKLNRARRARCCQNPQTISMEREPVESQRLLEAGAEQIQVQHQSRKTGSTNKSTAKLPISEGLGLNHPNLTKDRVRSSGATAGLVDKYYVDPSSGRKFRSRKEVLYYLETGTSQPKKKKGTETFGSEDVGTGNSGGNRKKKLLFSFQL
ncbi:hypothetical protein V6N13_009522 [Hibiscus sabdariffa]